MIKPCRVYNNANYVHVQSGGVPDVRLWIKQIHWASFILRCRRSQSNDGTYGSATISLWPKIEYSHTRDLYIRFIKRILYFSLSEAERCITLLQSGTFWMKSSTTGGGRTIYMSRHPGGEDFRSSSGETGFIAAESTAEPEWLPSNSSLFISGTPALCSAVIMERNDSHCIYPRKTLQTGSTIIWGIWTPLNMFFRVSVSTGWKISHLRERELHK